MTTKDRRCGWASGGTRHCRWSLWLLLSGMAALWPLCLSGATLSWNASTGATGYRVYSSIGATPFSLVSDVPGTSTPIVLSTNQPTRAYVTAYNAAGESGPSETVTNLATPPIGPVITLMPPGLSATNVIIGQTLNLSALVQNTGDTAWDAVDGALTLLQPGATRDSGPYTIVTAIIPPFTVAAKSSRAVAGTWAAPPGALTGIWSAYLVVKDVNNVWTASPFSYFTVSATQTNTPPTAPTGLKFSAIGTTSGVLSWQGDATAKTEVEESLKADPFKRIATVAEGTMRYTRTNLRRARDYSWRVREVKAGFPPSAYSNTVVRQ